MNNQVKVKVSKAEHTALKALLMNSQTSLNPRVYVNLEARFGDKQPKDGVIFETPVKRKMNRTLVIDTYGRGDVHNVKTPTEFSRKRKSKWNEPMPFPADLSAIETSLQSGKMRDRFNIVLGSKSDPFMWMDSKYGITKATLEILQQYLFKLQSIEIHTRSDLISRDDYLDLLQALDYRLGRFVTICIHVPKGTDSVVRMIEPGAPSRKRRFQAARKLRETLIGGTQIKIIREGSIEVNKDLAHAS